MKVRVQAGRCKSFSTCGVAYDTSCLKGVARTLTSCRCGLALANIGQKTDEATCVGLDSWMFTNPPSHCHHCGGAGLEA
eukprot:355857-Alexandrium_andersonii.AAC.1